MAPWSACTWQFTESWDMLRISAWLRMIILGIVISQNTIPFGIVMCFRIYNPVLMLSHHLFFLGVSFFPLCTFQRTNNLWTSHDWSHRILASSVSLPTTSTSLLSGRSNPNLLSIHLTTKVTRILDHIINGGDEEDRTPDPLLARQVLSQLSYTPTNLEIRSSMFEIRISKYLIYYMVGLGGLEPPTSRLSGVRSNQLSYRPIL